METMFSDMSQSQLKLFMFLGDNFQSIQKWQIEMQPFAKKFETKFFFFVNCSALFQLYSLSIKLEQKIACALQTWNCLPLFFYYHTIFSLYFLCTKMQLLARACYHYIPLEQCFPYSVPRIKIAPQVLHRCSFKF